MLRSEAKGTAIQSYAALVIAAPGRVLKESDQFLCCKAEDAGKPDVDYQSVTIKAMPVLLSRAQCAAWGRSMHWKGRVLYAIEPPEAEKKPKTSGKSRKSNSQ